MKSRSESSPLLAGPNRPKGGIHKGRLVVASLVVLFFIVPAYLIDLGILQSPIDWWESRRRDTTSKPFQWDQIKPKDFLEFHPCFEEFECAKLKLPLDYFNGTHQNSTISLAIAKLPARVPVTDPRYGGPILINPGGPGGSGVFLALYEAKALQQIVDAPHDPKLLLDGDARYHDIIGFDPRGIGNTEPAAGCMPDGASWWSWRLREATQGNLDSSDAALGRVWSMSHAYGASCKQFMDEESGPDIKQYITTASVARDMLEVVEKHAVYVAHKQSVPAPCKAKDTAKLQYWGFSYGTYLGYTFASMFPDRVGRLVLDGVVSSDDYNANLGNGSIHDAEKAMSSFYTFCVRAGPEACPLTTSNSTAEDVKTRVQGIVKSLYHNPLPMNTVHGPEVFTYSDAKNLFFGALYSPLYAFPVAGQLLAAIEAGNGTILDDIIAALQAAHIYHCPLNAAPFDLDVPQIAILCADGENTSDEKLEAFEEYLDLMKEISPTSGAIWSTLRMRCINWNIRALYRWQGAFGGNTSNPILFVSNTADPVTPLQSGRIMHEKFPGSALLVQDSAGHCSSAAPTPCTIKSIRQYFQSGELPKPGTVCIPPTSPFSLNSTDPSSPFYEPSLGSSAVNIYDSELTTLDIETLEAAKSLQKYMAENNRFWNTQDMERTHRMLYSSQQES